MQPHLSAQLDELAVHSQLKHLIRAHSAQRDFVQVSALVELTRLPELTKPALIEHGRLLSAWLLELSRLGDEAHADALIAALAVIATLTGKAPQPVTLEALVRERLAVHAGTPLSTLQRLGIAADLLVGCPSRQRRHWDRVAALVTAAEP